MHWFFCFTDREIALKQKKLVYLAEIAYNIWLYVTDVKKL